MRKLLAILTTCLLIGVPSAYAADCPPYAPQAIGGDVVGSLTFPDNVPLIWGTDEDFQSEYDEATDDAWEFGDGTNTFLSVTDQGTYAEFTFYDRNIYLIADEGQSSILNFWADDGDDAADKSTITVLDGGSMAFATAATEAARFTDAQQLLVGYTSAINSNSNLEVIDGGSSAPAQLSIITFNDQVTYQSNLILGASYTDTIGTLTETIDTVVLGTIQFRGVDIASNLDVGAEIKAIQNGSSGTSVPTDLTFSTSTSTAQIEAFRLDSSQRLLVGHTESVNTGADIEVFDSAAGAVISLDTFSTTDTHKGIVAMYKSASATLGTAAETASGEDLGAIQAVGVNSSNTFASAAAEILFEQDGAAGATYIPGRISFLTGTDAAARTERMRVHADGSVTIGDGITATELFHIESATDSQMLLKNTGNAATIHKGDANRTGTDNPVLSFQGFWNGTNVGEINIISGDDTTNKDDGYIRFRVAEGGSLSEAMRIEQDGTIGRSATAFDAALQVYSGVIELSDEETFNLPTASYGGRLEVQAEDDEYATALIGADGTVTLITNSANVANTDTDTNLCIYDGGTFAVIKNRLGATKRAQVTFTYE
jgi:hypothetical protein